eukprot:TRINITY_DN28910_c0_g1_i1.p1 TRINITY_DN28910_c0_g1~~TRINITY_DN28910_c0_g1_i1.p1  ORF type:complete len:129 (-),score=9.55 TRINITY_DN28910_c0_g1_i1:225-611(-)
MMAVVILAIAAGSVLLPFIGAQTISLQSQRMNSSVVLASSLLNEILADDYCGIISEYDGYTEAQGQLKDSHGAILSGEIYKKLSTKVECKEICLSENVNGAAAYAIIVNVKVFYNDSQIVSLSGLKGR